MGFFLTLAAFVASWRYGRRSLGAGMAVVLTAGYFYGIVRANFQDTFAAFVFDAAVFGLYLARFTLPNALAPQHANGLTAWTWVLIGWPFLMLALGAGLFPQHVLIQLVGLRAAIWFLPILLLGASARSEDLTMVARTLAVLNLVALVFAAGEYFLGVERFYPRNAFTSMIYRSKDVAGGVHRIPAIFPNSATFGETMVATVPWLVGGWQRLTKSFIERWLFIVALLAAALGTFLCGSRMPVVRLIVLVTFLAYLFRDRMRHLFPVLGIAMLVGFAVSGSTRLQRFTTLQDTDYVAGRIEMSINVGIMDLLSEYPLGAGLGSAFGTSIPSFLMHLVDQPAIGAEMEFARIGLEQGLLGLTIWLAFLLWFAVHRCADQSPDWKLGCKLMFMHTILTWGSGLIGCGILTTIPVTGMLLFQMGLLARDRPLPFQVRQPARRNIDSTLRRRDTMPLPQRDNKPCLFPG